MTGKKLLLVTVWELEISSDEKRNPRRQHQAKAISKKYG